jgi:hypothetical protein
LNVNGPTVGERAKSCSSSQTTQKSFSTINR